MLCVKKFRIIAALFAALLSCTSVYAGNELLEKYCSRLNKTAEQLELNNPSEALKRENTAIALSAFEKIFRNPDNQDTLDRLPMLDDGTMNPLFDMFDPRAVIQPTSIFGTVALSRMLSNQITSAHDLKWHQTQKLITFLEKNQELCNSLIECFKAINISATNVFMEKRPFVTWVAFNKGNPSALYTQIANISALIGKASFGLFLSNSANALIKGSITLAQPVLESITEHIPPLSVASYGLNGLEYCSTFVATLAEPLSPLVYISLGLGIGLSLYSQYQPKRDPSLARSNINALMNPFLLQLQALSKICKKLSSQYAILQEFELPETFDATNDDVFKIIECLKIIGDLDACLALATASADKRITPIMINDNCSTSNEETKTALNELFQIGCSDQIKNEWKFDQRGFFMMTQAPTNAIRQFLRNIRLSQGAGFVISPREQLSMNMPLFNPSSITVNFMENTHGKTPQSLYYKI